MPARCSRLIAAVISTSLAVGILLVTAIPVVACSCIGPQPMAAYAGDPEQVVFTGVVQRPDGRGVPVKVSRSFQGADSAPIVWLDAAGFGGDGGMCGATLPPAGAEWIFVAWRSPDSSELVVNLCSPHAAASDPSGQAMFRDAVATFGEGVTPGADPSSSAAPASGGSSLPVALLVAGALALLIGIGASIILAGRGRRSESGD